MSDGDSTPGPSARTAAGDEASETALIARARDGDAEAFEALVLGNMSRTYALAYRLVGNREDAEELAQETFLRAYRSIRSFGGRARFSTWIYRITVNLSLNHLKRSRWRGFLGLDEAGDIRSADASPHHRVAEAEVSRKVREALAGLPAKQRITVVLKTYHEKSHEEIARILGCTIGTSKANYFHGIQKLKRALAEGKTG